MLYTGCLLNFFNNDGFKTKKAPELFRYISIARVLIHTYEGRIKTLTDDAIACNKDNPTSIIKLHAAKTLSLRLSIAKEICKNMELVIFNIEDTEIRCISKIIPYVEKIDEGILLEAMSGESIDQLRNIDTDEALNEIFNKYSEIVIQSL